MVLSRQSEGVRGETVMKHSKHSARNLLRQGLCAALLYAAAITAAHAALGAAVVLPPLTQPASGEHHVGKVVWADLVTPDLDGAKRFYGALFGWTFRSVPGDSNYALALLDGEPVGGLFQKALAAGAIAAASLVDLSGCAGRRCRAAGRSAARRQGAV